MFLKSAHRLRGKTNLNDKLLPADWLEDLLQIKANSPLIGLLKGQLKLWLADTEGGREGEIKRMRSKSQSTVWELAGGVGGSVRKAFAKKGWGWCRGGVAIFSHCSGLPGDLCCCGDELLAVPDGLELLGNGALRLREGVRERSPVEIHIWHAGWIWNILYFISINKTHEKGPKTNTTAC